MDIKVSSGQFYGLLGKSWPGSNGKVKPLNQGDHKTRERGTEGKALPQDAGSTRVLSPRSRSPARFANRLFPAPIKLRIDSGMVECLREMY